MRKFYAILAGIVFTLLFATCTQFTADIDDYLSRWSSEAYITDSTIKAVSQNDLNSIPSVPSAEDVSVVFKVRNPKLFPLDLPPEVDAAKNVIVFEHLTRAPVAGTDYTLTQSEDRQNLILTYKASFLNAHEWGEQDLSSTLTLYAKDGRKFKQTYTLKVKANTPPPNPGYTVAKTTGSPAYYVLCITVPDTDMRKTAGEGKLLHKDLARVEINGTPYTFSVNEAQTAFVKPDVPVFIAHSDIEKLSEPDADDVPADGSWVLYYKTDVEVKDGAVKKDYTVRLADAQGLVSGILNASTKSNKAEAETVRITKGTKISGSGSEADPTIIGTDSTGAELSVASATGNTTVHCTVSEIGGSTPVKYDGNPVTVPLPLNGAGEKKYKMEYYTDGEGFAATPVQTVYYKVAQGHSVTFDANGGSYPDGTTAVSKVALHGTAVSAPDPLPVQQGFGVTGWYKDKACSAGQAWNFATDTVTGDMTLYAQWTAGGGIPYKVEHYQQNVNDDNYPAAPTDTDNATGTTGANAAVTLKNYSGFEAGTYTATTIAADGSTVVKVLYKRKQITVTFDPNGGTIDGNTGKKSVTGKYGAPLTAPTASWAGHGFSGWNPPLSAGSTFPAEENTEYTAQWDLNSYTVTYTVVGGNGKIQAGSDPLTANATVSVVHGGSVTFTAVPDTGYEVDSWSSNVGNISSDKTKATLSNIDGDKTVTVKFKKKSYNVTFSVENSVGGTIKARPEGGSENTTGSVSVEHGKKVTFTAAPADNSYEVEKWTVDGTAVADHTSTSYELPSVTGNKDVTVKFKKKVYNVTYSVEGGVGGTLTAKVDSNTIQSGYKVEHGKTVTFTAAPARGWHIDSWTVSTDSFESGGGTGTSATLKVTAEATVTVKFEPDAAFNLASSETGAWKILREEAARTKGPGTIVIDGTITATGGDNAGEITLGRSLTIEGKSGSSTDILDAAGLNRIFKVSSGTLTLKNLTLKNGKAEGSDGPGDGGAIYVHGASVKITGCTLTDNTANKNGGAVYATKRGDNAAHVTISGGSINGNTVTINSGFGGGIYINDGCELTLKDNVTVKDNKAARGGGVRANKSTVTMNGCTFEGNKSTHGDASNGCGGVYVNGGTVTMQSCTLKSNDGKVRAGGLLVEGGAKVTMDGCTITGNTATTGGGIYITGGSSIVTLNNGVQIKDNTATTGGGVYVQDGTFKMSGSAIVTPSTGSDQYTPGKNDVYLKTGQAITVDGTLSNNPAARITPEEYKENVLVLRGNITDGSPQNRKKFTVPPEKVTEDSENWNVFWYIADNGNLKAEVEDPDMLKTVTDGSPNNTIIKLGNISDLKTVEIWGYRKIMLKADRAVTLTCSSKGNNYKHLQVQEHASLILKGPITLQGTDYGSDTQYALYVENGGKAEIKDSVTITGFKNGNIGPVVSDGKLTMSGGEISGNKAKNGGGVYIHASWRSFKMTGGTIKGNLATEHGGGVYVDGSYNDGYPIRGQFWLEGGTIEGNTADKGGGVYSQGEFTMSGGTITKNTATNNGRAIMLNYYFHWDGGEIKGNLGNGSVVGDSGGNFSNNTNPRKEPS